MKKLVIFAITIMTGFVLAGQASAQTVVEGFINSNTTWSDDILLRGPVFVRSGATLTINPGVTVYGKSQHWVR